MEANSLTFKKLWKFFMQNNGFIASNMLKVKKSYIYPKRFPAVFREVEP